MNKAELLKKVPWRKVFKYVGAGALGVASVMGAFETDEKVQKVCKKAASKLIKEKGSQ